MSKTGNDIRNEIPTGKELFYMSTQEALKAAERMAYLNIRHFGPAIANTSALEFARKSAVPYLKTYVDVVDRWLATVLG